MCPIIIQAVRILEAVGSSVRTVDASRCMLLCTDFFEAMVKHTPSVVSLKLLVCLEKESLFCFDTFSVCDV